MAEILENSFEMDGSNVSLSDMSRRDICLLYLKKYAEKDIEAVESLFAENIVLRDWKIRVEGKAEAVRETRNNFESAESIEIEILSTYENEDTVAAELKITVDSTEELYVVDVMTVNGESRISSIRAYLGRGD